MLTANDLHKAWDRSGRFLSHHSRMRLTEDGLTLGADTIIVPIGRDNWERPVLEIEGNEERILALLSVAYEQPVLPHILGNLQNASRCLCKGELALAYIHLAFTGLQPLEDADAPRRLFMAGLLLDQGMDGAEMLKGLGLLPRGINERNWRQLLKTRGNPYHRPGKTDGAGQFCSAEDVGFTVAAAPEHPAPATAQVASVKTPENAPNQEQPSLKTPERPDTIRESDWNAMKAALDKRTDISAQEKATILSIFAWEGGLKDDGNGVVAGLLPSTLKTMGASTPKTAADAADLYVNYLDRSMHTIGGLDAVSQINDTKAASAFADTMFYQGTGAGTQIIQQAINDVRTSNKQIGIEVDERMGPGTLAAYKDLANNPETRQALLNALCSRRLLWSANRSDDQTPSKGDQKRFKAYR